MTWIRRHPLATFFVLAYGLSWTYWIPLALSRAHVAPGSNVTHFPGLLGPGVSAFIVAAVANGRAGVVDLLTRMIRISTPGWRFLVYSVSPLAFLVLALLVSTATDAAMPKAEDFGVYSGLPPMGLLPVFLLVLLFNGFGEETGWRGFALGRLQLRFGDLGGTLALAALWAGWHAPAFFFVERYRQLSLPTIIGGFGLGIVAGTLVLSRVSAVTSGSILAVSLWHALYNLTSATAASRGVIAAVTTTCVMVWAAWLLVRHAARLRGSILSHADP